MLSLNRGGGEGETGRGRERGGNARLISLWRGFGVEEINFHIKEISLQAFIGHDL